MSSCTNSSNIQSSLVTQIIREEGDGKRVAFKITTNDAGITSGITFGSVIRYDATTNSYELSKADKPATAEVIGIVENIVNGGSSLVYTVVASGLINYPNINSVINRYGIGCTVSDGGTGGDEGGADVFFLSNHCAGKLQLLEPIITGHIVKPVMQRVAVGAYNGIVLNYIGYEVANAATSDITNVQPVGTIYYTNPGQNLPGFLDVTEPTSVEVESYPDLYENFKTNFGPYKETITLVDPNLNLNNLINSTITQKTPYNTVESTGKVVSVDQNNNTIVVEKESDQPYTNTSKKLNVGALKFDASSSDISSFTVPSVPVDVVDYVAPDGTVKGITLTPYMRAQKETTSVFIPSTVEISVLTCDSIQTNGVTVGDKLGDLEGRIQALESRLGI